jgi:hypothetical protein
VTGRDGVRVGVDRECGAFIPTGEIHAKGSSNGMLAIMIQVSRFVLAAGV